MAPGSWPEAVAAWRGCASPVDSACGDGCEGTGPPCASSDWTVVYTSDPGWLAAVHPTHRVPHHAEIALAIVVSALVLAVDLRGAIGFSSFAVLLYYAVTNASAWTLGYRLVPAVGLVGCLLLFKRPVTWVLQAECGSND